MNMPKTRITLNGLGSLLDHVWITSGSHIEKTVAHMLSRVRLPVGVPLGKFSLTKPPQSVPKRMRLLLPGYLVGRLGVRLRAKTSPNPKLWYGAPSDTAPLPQPRPPEQVEDKGLRRPPSYTLASTAVADEGRRCDRAWAHASP